MWRPKWGEWYEVDPREFGERYVQVFWVSDSRVCVHAPQCANFILDLDEFAGCSRGPINPDNGRLEEE